MAMAGVALASCVNEVADVAQHEQKKSIIGFETPVLYNNAESRANVYGEIGNTAIGTGSVSYPKPTTSGGVTIPGETFVIYSVKHTSTITEWPASPNYSAFSGSEVSYDESLGGWAPKTTTGNYYYWSDQSYLSFAASSPFDLEQASGWNADTKRYFSQANGLTIEDYEVRPIGNQYDLLYTDAILNKSMTDYNESAGTNGYNGVILQFKHALSSIHIAVRKNEGNTDNIILTDAKIINVKNKGTFHSIVTSPTKNWTPDNQSSKTDYIMLENGSIAFPEVSTHITQLTGGDQANYLLIMPQELTTDHKLVVEYTINGAPFSKEISLVNYTVKEWVMGYRYTYELNVSSSSESHKKIYFAPQTAAWDDGGTVVINM